MTEPKKVLLGAFEWSIIFGKFDVEDAAEFDVEPENLLGFSDKKNLVMYIDEELNTTMKKVTFLHELVHTMSDTFGLGFNDSENEDMVNQIGNAFYNFMKQNPKAVEWLIKEV